MEKKLVKLVVYASGRCAGAVPMGCPKEYSIQTLEARIAFADWLYEHGQQYYLGEKDGVVFYTYKDFFTYDVAVVEVDISRPWMFDISNEDGSEHIYSFKSCSEYNEVSFMCIPFPLKPRVYLGLEK